jgi:heparan-alpha-glucosaminide N-acetyltransferase
MDTVTSPVPPGQRLVSLDTYRGLVLALLCLEGPRWGWQEAIIEAKPDSSFWNSIAHQTDHIEWAGCVLWDLIQPSFMFMVGVSMAYSYTKRGRLGHSRARMFGHAAVRALALILLGVFLRSLDAAQTDWTFEDVLTQIGLGYIFLFLLWGKSPRVQIVAVAGLLVGYWALFAFYPIRETAGNPEHYPQFTGFLAHWNLNANPAHAADTWFLNLFPRDEPFAFHPEGYNTLNFIPSLATMILGLLAGEVLRSDRSGRHKALKLAIAGLALVAVGGLLHLLGICPLVKKTWTPAFTLFSGGWCLLILATLYFVVDLLDWKKWTFPLVVIGTNSIALYVMIHLLPEWIDRMLQTHLGDGYTLVFGEPFSDLLRNVTCALILWLLCLWMYRRKIFLRL